ncbi:MAG: hypothetical protein ONA90_06475 [candidate division KSB1 bacterium]|nr:hypothetical protein [candidate division KSB1 bacterium]
MDLKPFDVLEEKISLTINLIKKLKQENRELHERIQSLQLESQDKDKQIAGLREELQRLKTNTQAFQQFAARETEIRGKIEKMLAKLEELQLQY